MFDFPKWFRKTFRTELRFGGRGSTRPQRRASLGVECLEDRVVLNGLPPGYALTGGNLYHITSSGQQLLDSGVSSACVETINGTDYVYDLRSTGQLWRGQMRPSSGWTGWTQLDSGVSSFSVQTINGTDYVYDLRSTGQLWRGREGLSTGWTGWTQLDSGVASSAVQDLNGTDYVYDLRSTGQLWRGKEGASTGWTGWTQLDSGVASVSVQDINGTDYVYDLRSSGQLCISPCNTSRCKALRLS
jgi:hypothetical protein